MANVGLNFGPNAQGGQLRSSPASPTQDAIRILSFRMPTILGSAAPAPPSLLGGPTAQGGQMGGSMAENWLRMLFGGGQMNGPMGGMGGGATGSMGMGMSSMGSSPYAPPSSSLPASFQFGGDPEQPQPRDPGMPSAPQAPQPQMPQMPSFGNVYGGPGGLGGRNRV